ncbi:MAG: tetratricopeptide repeat protein, partial [Phycisphaerae bacterium]
LDEADELCRKALANEPDDVVELVRTLNAHGVVQKKLGNYAAASSAYGRALELYPDAVWAHNNLATVQALQGNFEQAESTLRKATGLTGEGEACNNHAWRKLGVVMLALREESPIPFFSQAVACNKLDHWARIHRAAAKMCLETNRPGPDAMDDIWDEINAVFTVWGSSRPIPSQFLRVRAEAQLSRGRWLEAEQDSRSALDQGDLQTAAMAILATSLARQSKIDEAKACLVRAKSAWPDELSPHGAVRAIPIKAHLWVETHDNLSRLLQLAQDTIDAMIGEVDG